MFIIWKSQTIFCLIFLKQEILKKKKKKIKLEFSFAILLFGEQEIVKI